MSTSPLFLNVMAVAYRGVATEEFHLPVQDSAKRQAHLLKASGAIRRMRVFIAARSIHCAAVLSGVLVAVLYVVWDLVWGSLRAFVFESSLNSIVLLVSALDGWIVGLVLGMLYFGGDTVVKHYLLRMFLRINRLIPFRIVPFLESMRERILVQRAGPHYRFIHRTFQEHIAALTDEDIEQLATSVDVRI